jgi:RNA polymerase sigma factor (sigma-70 family)
MAATEEDRGTAVKQLEGLVKMLAKKFSRGMAHRGDHYNDLEQEGICGVLLALDRFDSTRGVKFSTYAYPYIISAMQEYAEQFTLALPLSHARYVLNKQLDAAAKQPRLPEIGSTSIARQTALYEDVANIPLPAPQLGINDMIALGTLYGEILNLPADQQRVLLGCYFEHKTLESVGLEINRTRERARQLRELAVAALKKIIFPRRKRACA